MNELFEVMFHDVLVTPNTCPARTAIFFVRQSLNMEAEHKDADFCLAQGWGGLFIRALIEKMYGAFELQCCSFQQHNASNHFHPLGKTCLELCAEAFEKAAEIVPIPQETVPVGQAHPVSSPLPLSTQMFSQPSCPFFGGGGSFSFV